MKTIGIIGGGPGAIVFLERFLEKFRKADSDHEIEVIIFEKGKTIGPGLPYGFEEDCYLLNLPVSTMSAEMNKRGHFAKWLAIHYPHIRTQFPPRKYFGYFLVDLWKEIQDRFKQRGLVLKSYTQTEVTEVIKIGEREYQINAEGISIIANAVVLCTGHMPNPLYGELIPYPGYRSDPWASGAYDGIDPDQTVCILGSRLSAIDVALKLREQKHRGKIKMFSKSGLLPAVLSREVPSYDLEHLAWNKLKNLKEVSLNDVMNLFWKEMSRAEGKEINFDRIYKTSAEIAPMQWIAHQIQCAEKGCPPWQQVLFALYPIVPQIWVLLSSSDQIRFMQYYHSIYMTYLAAFPLDNAHKIKKLLVDGQLEVVGGHKTVRYQGDQFRLVCSNGSYECEILFNCTGLGYDPSVLSLYRQMIEKGSALQHPCGGIYVNTQTFQVLDRKKKSQQNLYALGEITHGSFLATADMSQLISQADNLASHLVFSLSTSEKKSEFTNKPSYTG